MDSFQVAAARIIESISMDTHHSANSKATGTNKQATVVELLAVSHDKAVQRTDRPQSAMLLH